MKKSSKEVQVLKSDYLKSKLKQVSEQKSENDKIRLHRLPYEFKEILNKLE
jgi:hypothetical protein